MEIIRSCSIFFIIFIVSIKSYSQIVNIESARMQSDTTGWMGGAGAGLTLAKNTQNIVIFNADAHLQYKTQKNLWLILGNVNFLKAGDARFLNNTFIHFRFNRKLNDWLRWEVFTQAQDNQVTQIDSRYLLGTGPRFKIFSNHFIRLYAATLVMHEWEKEKTIPRVKHTDFRNSSYVSFTITPTPAVEVISTTFYQPLFEKINDYRLMNQSVLKVKASKHFSLAVQWNYLYDRFPAGTAPHSTYNFTTGIGYEF